MNNPEVHNSQYETEEFTEQFYQKSEDPWNNKGKYVKWFESLGSTSTFLNNLEGSKIHLIDIGCGGGNVLEGLITKFLEVTDDIKVSGIDISPTAISYLRTDDRFKEYSPDFIEDSISDENFNLKRIISMAHPSSITIVSIVDIFYYISSTKIWHRAADLIDRDLPVGSYIIVGDSAGSSTYRNYYINKNKVIENGESSDPIKLKGHRSKYFKWTVYQKVF